VYILMQCKNLPIFFTMRNCSVKLSTSSSPASTTDIYTKFRRNPWSSLGTRRCHYAFMSRVERVTTFTYFFFAALCDEPGGARVCT
jgi:hypothetical protein